MTHPRPTNDQVWAHIAEAASARSLCDRAQVGAAIVDTGDRIIATGYNGPPAGFDHNEQGCAAWCPRAGRLAVSDDADTLLTGVAVPPRCLDPDYSDCYSIHAEANALLASEPARRLGGTLYVTTDMCFGCARLVGNSGIAHVVIAPTGAETAHRNSEQGYALLAEVGIWVTRL